MTQYSNPNPGDIRVRVHTLLIENPLVGIDSVSFYEQEAIRLSSGGERVVGTSTEPLILAFDSANPEAVEVHDPTTDSVIGQSTVGAECTKAFMALYNLARHVQLKRDSL